MRAFYAFLLILAAPASLTAEQSIGIGQSKFVRGVIPRLDYQVWPGVSHFMME